MQNYTLTVHQRNQQISPIWVS